MDLTNPQIIMRNKEIAQLRAENARLKEELALSRDLRRSQAQVNGNLSEQLAKERERAKTRELALDAAVSSSCVLGTELAKEQNKLEMAEAIIAGFDTLITGLTNDLAAAQAMIEQMREKSEAAKNACMVASSGCSHIKTHAECNEARQFAHATKINVETALSALNEALALAILRAASAVLHSRGGV